MAITSNDNGEWCNLRIDCMIIGILKTIYQCSKLAYLPLSLSAVRTDRKLVNYSKVFKYEEKVSKHEVTKALII